MKTGLLWLDDRSKVSFAKKLERAVAYYHEKYGHHPNVCYVHPSCLPKGETLGKIAVRPAKDILPHHFWLGMKTH